MLFKKQTQLSSQLSLDGGILLSISKSWKVGLARYEI